MINITKSKLRTKLLSYYFNHPELEVYVRELARIIDEDPTNLLRELKRLEEEKLFVSEFRGKQRYFKINKSYPLYYEYKKIILKTIGVEGELKKIVEGVSNLRICFIYGSYASDKEKIGSDIDLFVVGEKIKSDLFFDRISSLERRIGREINFRIFSQEDLKKAIKGKNSFILTVLKNKKIFLIGNEKDIRKFD